MSAAGRPRAEVGQDEDRIDLAALPDPRPMVAVTSTATRQLLDGDVRRPAPVTNALLLGQQLAEARGAARALIDRTPTDLAVMVEELRRWYYTLHPDERERLLWQRFTEAKQRHARLQHAIEVVREALEVERPALVRAHAERDTLAIRPLPATIEEEASGIRTDAVRRYQSVGIECQQREDAIAELERLLPSPEQALNELTEATVRLLEAVVTVAREAFVRRVRESGELEHLRSRFERLTAASTTHAAEIEQWSQQVGRPLRIPRVAFLWPPARVWQALLDAPMDAPELLWDDDPRASSA
jgi:phosphoglycolate phosphatase-like HAD superfamily hydrolase